MMLLLVTMLSPVMAEARRWGPGAFSHRIRPAGRRVCRTQNNTMGREEPGDVEPLGELTAFDAAKVGGKDKLGGIDAPESSRDFGNRLSKTNPQLHAFLLKRGARKF